MLIPVVNPQQAGLCAASADMNAYSAAAQFLCSPPMAHALAAAPPQAITAATVTAITWAAPDRDNDTTWSAGSPSLFLIGTQGYYEVAAHVSLTAAATAAECFILVTYGAANPAGPGTSSWWHGSGLPFTGTNFILASAGLIPVELYANDQVQFMVQASANCATAATSGFTGDWSHRMVST